MSYKNWRNQEVNDRLMESWGFKAPKSEILTESVDAAEQELEEAHCGGVHEDAEELDEGEKQDHDGDGDIDSDDYLAAKDKAIKANLGEDMIRKTIREAITKALKNREA